MEKSVELVMDTVLMTLWAGQANILGPRVSLSQYYINASTLIFQ